MNSYHNAYREGEDDHHDQCDAADAFVNEHRINGSYEDNEEEVENYDEGDFEEEEEEPEEEYNRASKTLKATNLRADSQHRQHQASPSRISHTVGGGGQTKQQQQQSQQARTPLYEEMTPSQQKMVKERQMLAMKMASAEIRRDSSHHHNHFSQHQHPKLSAPSPQPTLVQPRPKETNLTFKETQLMEMEQQNNRLLNSLIRVHQRSLDNNSFSVNRPIKHVSRYAISRRKEEQDIQKANQRIAMRLGSVKSSVRSLQGKTLNRTGSAGGSNESRIRKPFGHRLLVQPEWQS